MICIYLTIPVTTVTGERFFSSMKIIKTYLRDSMCQKRLSSLALISIEKELGNKVNVDEMVEQFGSVSGRQMAFE